MAARSCGVGVVMISRRFCHRILSLECLNSTILEADTKTLAKYSCFTKLRLGSPCVRAFRCANRLEKRVMSSKASQFQCWKCNTTIPVGGKTYQYTCSKCASLLPPDPNLNYFAVLGLDVTFDIDILELSARFKELQKLFHPDKFGLKSEKEQEFSANHSSQVNKAYQTLLKPLSRGVYILELNDLPFEEQDFSMEQTFLMDIMQKNEELDESKSVGEVSRIASENCAFLEECISEASAAFKRQDFAAAKLIIARLKYFDNIDGKAKEKLLQLKLQC